MGPPEVTDADIVNGFADILREKGYDATTLKELSARLSVGSDFLAKRYPGGKKAIAHAVIAYMEGWSKQFITDVLMNGASPPRERLNTVLTHFDRLYDGGRTGCLMRVLSTSTNVDLMGAELCRVINGWIDAFTRLGRDFGQAEAKAYQNGNKVLMLVQGSLVLSAALDGEEAFQMAMVEIRDIYLPADTQLGKA